MINSPPFRPIPTHVFVFLKEQVKNEMFYVRLEYTVTVKIFKIA